MTLEELQNRFVRILANQGHLRYWMHLNYPNQAPWEMALASIDIHGSPLEIADLEAHGFRRVDREGLIFYVVHRLDANGQPFRSSL